MRRPLFILLLAPVVVVTTGCLETLPTDFAAELGYGCGDCCYDPIGCWVPASYESESWEAGYYDEEWVVEDEYYVEDVWVEDEYWYWPDDGWCADEWCYEESYYDGEYDDYYYEDEYYYYDDEWYYDDSYDDDWEDDWDDWEFWF
jgi:hypothetical protein